LSNAYLSGADLSGADLSGADLSGAKLSRADLSGADLSGADLSGADLSGANVSFSILVGIESENYESVTVDTESDFRDAVCDNVDFIYCISRDILSENIPNIVSNKKDLKLILERKVFNKQKLESILEISKLPNY